MFKHLKKFQAELNRYHDVNYASKVEIDCAKAKSDLVSYKMESQKSFNEYTQKINDLNQTISEMKKELFTDQETISIMSQEKEAQNKFYKTREDKEIEKVISLENKVKYLKKAQRANPRLYDIDQLIKCECLLKELSKSNITSKSFEALQQHAIDLELALQQCQEQIKNDKTFKENQSKVFLKEHEQYFEIQDLKAQLQDKGIAIMLADHNLRAIGWKIESCITSVTACNDSLNAKTSNVNFVCVTYGKCVLNDNHDMCVLHYINGVNTRTKQPIVVPISTREPKRTMNQSVATPLKKTVASESTNQKPRSTTRKKYEHVSKTRRWWYSKITPPRYKWKPKTSTVNVTPNLVEIIIFIVGSGCSKHVTGNLKLLSNFVEQFLGTVKFRNDQIAPILGYGDLVQGNITIKRGNDLLTGSRGTDLYSITLQDTSTPNPICLMAKASSSQARLWHHRLSHLNFDTINLLLKYDIVTGLPKLKFVKDHLCFSFELRKAKPKSFKTKTTSSSKRRLQILHMDLCGPMRVESFNGKKYVLVIVDHYSRYTWTHFLRSKDETTEVLINFLKLVQRGLHAQVRIVRTNKGMDFLNKTLHAYFAQEGIEHQTSIAQTHEQNGVIKRQNCTLVEAARTMLSAAKVPLYFWAEAIATTCFTQNRSLVIPQHEKTPYHIINGRKPSVKLFHIFSSLCYIVRDGENLDKMKEKVTTSNELDLLFSLMFIELLNETTPVVSKSSDVTAADAPNPRQQQNTTQSTSTIVATDTPPLNIQTTPDTTSQAPTVTTTKNINQ
ncbi:retrovirus-related pol polyprotein from transposon TNT 1-94, partial [Tanacetum coccineum]